MGRMRFLSLKLEHLWVLTVIVGVFIFVNTHPIRPNDFWWHITVGKEILETHAIPITDEFSYTMYGEPYPSYQMFWLMEVFLYTIYDLGGPALTILIQSMIITAAYATIIYIGYWATNSWRLAAFGGIFAVALGINDWNVRPQSIAFLLGSLCIWEIYSFRLKHDWRYLLPLPVLSIIWVNSHGTFPLCLIMIGIWLADEVWIYLKSRRDSNNKRNVFISAMTLLISSLVIVVNPRGIGILSYLKTMGSNQIVQNLVVEWAPPSIKTLQGGLFYTAIFLCGLVIIISPRKPRVFEVLTFLIFAVLGINTSRGVIWFGVVMAPIFVQHLHSIVESVRTEGSNDNLSGSFLINTIIAGFLLLLALITLPWFKERLPLPAAKAGVISSETPIKATEFLIREDMPIQVFHAMSFGSYLIWAAQPTYKVFVDSRIELYPLDIWRDYLSISNAEADWDKQLVKYEVNTLMLSSNGQSPLIFKVSNSGDWVSVYKDDVAEIFTRIIDSR